MRSARMSLPGHPDKVCDLVAEAIVDEYLKRDPESRVRVNVAGGRGALFINGDVKSQADFDVAAVVRRMLASLGIISDLEPFIALEPVAPDQASAFGLGGDTPTSVIGYATQETPELIPATLDLAKVLAKKLDEARQTNEAWFWCGGDAEIVVTAEKSAPSHVSLRVEHGSRSIQEVRTLLASWVREVAPDVHVSVNHVGASEFRGIGNVMGGSCRQTTPYGDMLPFPASAVGKDFFHIEKAGAWLARWAARQCVVRGAKSALVNLLYVPAQDIPYRIAAKDERGRDLTAQIDPATLSLQRVQREWWRNGLNVDTTRWGFVGEFGLPWEV